MNESRLYGRFLWLLRTSFLLALVVVLLGAFVRLSDAGLGCPDWPGCYGKLIGVPEAAVEIAQAESQYPQRAVDVAKAWKEVVHRYAAGLLGLLILAMAVLAVRNRAFHGQPVIQPVCLLALVICQALLGMWTVTLQLKPVIVMAHLLGGFMTLALLWWLLVSAALRDQWHRSVPWGLKALTLLGVAILVGQIGLGGWTSSNYAALACPDFPTCQTQWWPDMDFGEAFVLWRGLGVDYEFGVLESPARTAIHIAHRLGAIVTAAYLLFLGVVVIRRSDSWMLRATALAVLALLALQVALGISNVVLHLPIAVAVAHNGTAALLLLAVLTLVRLQYPPRARGAF